MISEPLTLASDWLLGAVAAWLALRAFRIARLWALGFLAASIAAFLGGTWHGLAQSEALWKATLLAAGLASFGMLAGAAIQNTSGTARSALLVVAGLKLLALAAWAASRDEFVAVVIDSGLSLAILAALYLWRFNGWMLAGVAASLAGGAVQAAFRQNDLYHLIEIAALLLFYRGLSVKCVPEKNP